MEYPIHEHSTQTQKPATDDHQYVRHLRGWLSYAFASEVFAVVGLSTFLPICLEQFARDNGFVPPEKTTRCPSGAILSPTEAASRCVVKFGWVWIDTASFSLYIYSLSVALQALTVISMGGIADHPLYRKPLLLTFAFLGSISAILFFPLPSSSPMWLFVGVLACTANVSYGASVVAMNSYLPNLARETTEVRAAWEELKDHGHIEVQTVDEDSSSAPVLAESSSEDQSPAQKAYNTVLARSTSRISALGIALGYAGGIFLLVLAVIPVSLLHSSTFSLRLAIGLSGIWWAIGSIPAGIWLPNEAVLKNIEGPGATLPSAFSRSVGREIMAAWIRLGQMLRWGEIKRLRNTFWYLGAWFLLSDGFGTLVSTSVLFAKTTLHMPSSRLIIIGAISPLAGIIGSLAWPVFQRYKGWSDLQMIKMLVALVGLIPLYGCLGFLPIFRNSKMAFGGLTTEGEIYVLAVFFGSIYGSFQGYSRSFFSLLIPPREEARWYGLYSITDKSSSFIGPLVVGLISDVTGNIRYGFFFLIAMMYFSLPLLACVDVERGQTDARQYIAEFQGGYRTGYIPVAEEDT